MPKIDRFLGRGRGNAGGDGERPSVNAQQTTHLCEFCTRINSGVCAVQQITGEYSGDAGQTREVGQVIKNHPDCPNIEI